MCLVQFWPSLCHATLRSHALGSVALRDTEGQNWTSMCLHHRFYTILISDARLFLFGSSKNGFGFRNSDIDICMTLEGHVREEIDFVDVIISLAKLLKKHKDCANVLAITTAKVPIVKFYLRSCKREADISLYNTLALENTKMLSTYAKLDDRVVTLGYTVKVFAKVSLFQ